MSKDKNKKEFIEKLSRGQNGIEQSPQVTPSEKSVFELDGTDFRPNKEARKLIVTTDAITNFITARKHAPNRILVGPKGSGKSLLLRLKSWSYSLEADPLNISDGGDFSIKFDFSGGLNKKDLYTYVGDDDYRIIWEFSIKYFILRRIIMDTDIEHPIYGREEAKIPGAEILDKIAPKYSLYLTTMGDILSLLLQNRSMISEVDQCLFALNGALRLLETVVDRPITLYIDNVDQAFLEKLVEGAASSNETQLADWVYDRKRKPIVKIWLNANIAFLRVIWNINKSFSFISLFAAVRYEAWNHFFSSGLAKNIPQIESNIILLEYKKRDLTQLIENFISIQNKTLKKLLHDIVHSERIHPKAKNNQINREKFMDFMIRHTFGNPRDLIYLLNELQLEVKRVYKTKQKVDINYYGHLIDRISNEKVFKNFAHECLPVFPFNELDQLLKKYKRNFFKRHELEEEEKILIRELFRYGLIGVIDESGMLFFERGANYPEEKIELRDSPFYFTHPCLDYPLSQINKEDNFYYPYCVIGAGLPFKSKSELEYYLPKDTPGKFKNEIQEKFKAFYESDFSISEFSKIPNRINTKYTSLLLQHLIGSKFQFNSLLKASIKKGLGSCKRKEEDLQLLSRNIKLRIILTLSTLLGIYTEGKEVISLFEKENKHSDNSYLISTTTFTHDCFTANRSINLTNVLKSLSDFEAETIFDFLRSPDIDKFLDAENHTEEKQKKINQAKITFAAHFPHFNF